MRFRVLTFNTFKLGGPVPPERVMDEMLALQPDVLLLQEVFNTPVRVPRFFRSRNAKRLLTRRLGSEFHLRWLGTSGPPGPLGWLTFGRFRDGLMVAARKDRWDFDAETGHRQHILPSPVFGRRGAQVMSLTSKGPERRRVLAANTHLTFGVKESHSDWRIKQADELVRFLSNQESAAEVDAVVLGGDFNAHSEVGGEEREIRTVMFDPATHRLRFRDAFRETEPDAPGYTFELANTLVKGKREASARLDYLFVRPETVKVASASVVLDDPDLDQQHNLSDHYGLLAELEL